LSDVQWQRHEIRNRRAKIRREKSLEDQRILDDLMLSIQKASKTQELVRVVSEVVEKKIQEQLLLEERRKLSQNQKEMLKFKAAEKTKDLSKVIAVLKEYP
jgi:uncharacterized protein YjgD (DUF1641 family)